mmetsp:Transcript_35185/g.110769  ORF Transcript_35185/g.110769 Transcript_35185/m.110769 type:complete len:194 (-) Transcript_35185:526-1107(-)
MPAVPQRLRLAPQAPLRLLLLLGLFLTGASGLRAPRRLGLGLRPAARAMPGLQEQARGSRPEDRAAVARLEVEKCTSLLGETSPADGGTSEPAPPLWNLPNVLTLSRVVMVPAMQVLFFWDNPLRNIACAGLFALAAITDFFDGYLARKWKITSPFGAFLDPVADKLMVAAVLIQVTPQLLSSSSRFTQSIRP